MCCVPTISIIELCNEKPAFCKGKNKGTDQMQYNRAADQHLFSAT